ncbi:MAG: inositol monophosphatase [Bacteroidetes bacterium]|nr:inositol monophosphatase [Bacteroidota bacterium]
MEKAAERIRHWEHLRDRGELDIGLKNQNDLVTAADRESESVIRDYLESTFPSVPFLGEETGWSQSLSGSEYWVLDPLDGTTNFSHGFPQYSISLALIREGQPVLGVIHEVVRNDWFYAISGEGAWKNGKTIHVSERPVSESLFATGFPYRDFSHQNRFFQTLDTVIRSSHGVRRAGSAASDLAYTASGVFGGFWEYGLKPWDVAAGILLVREAGGMVVDYGGGEGMLQSGNIIAGSPHTCRFLLETIRQAYEGHPTD